MMRTTRTRPCSAKVSTSPSPTAREGLSVRWPFTRTLPSAIRSAARPRDFRNLAWKSHLSRRIVSRAGASITGSRPALGLEPRERGREGVIGVDALGLAFLARRAGLEALSAVAVRALTVLPGAAILPLPALGPVGAGL